MATFAIKLFGAIEITCDGVPLAAFRSQKALVLLAYLISEGRPVTRDYLAGLAWPDMSQQQALGLLRRTLHDLSSKLPGCLVIDRRTVQFCPETDMHNAAIDVDIVTFTSLAVSSDPAAWTQASDLYRAPFLEGIYLDDAAELESWLLRAQEAWQQQIDLLLVRLIQSLCDEGNYAAALTFANRRLTLTPWREEAQRQVMLLYLFTGQRSAALAQYARCVAVLADEFGVEPDPQTEELHAQIQQAAPYPPHNLLPPSTPFWGRQTELADLTRLIANANQRLITLTGPGGMGKTRLALAAAERQLGRPTAVADVDAPVYTYFTHGVYLVALAAVETTDGLVSTIAAALNLRLEADGTQRTPTTQLLNYLQTKRLLLILDNFEQLLQPPEALAATHLLLEILRLAPNVKLLVTSRERLQLAPEQIYPVQGLAYPDTPEDGEIVAADFPALALFTQVAQQLRPTFHCEGVTATTVSQICSVVAGMPLAIELAAAAVTVLSPPEILRELTQSLDLLATTTRHIAVRHRSMRAAFATSWRQLSPAEQVAFSQLSVFRSGFTREAATAVATAALPVLAELANKSFLRYRQHTQRYEIHELLRQFGAEKLTQNADKGRMIYHQHCTYFTAKLAQWTRDARGAEQQTAFKTMLVESGNIRQAWQWIVDEGDLTLLVQAVDGLGIFYQWQGRYQEGLELYQAANRVLRVMAEEDVDGQVLLIKTLVWQANFCRMVGQPDRSNQHLQQCKLLLDRLDNTGQEAHSERAAVLMGQARLARDAGDFGSARQFYEQSVALYQELSDRWWVARWLTELCFVIRNSSAIASFAQRRQLAEESAQIAQQSVEICRTIGDRGGLVDALIQLGAGLFYLGRFDEAISTLEECVALATELHRQGSLVLATFFVGTTHLFAGRYPQADGPLQHALTVARAIGYQQQIGAILYNLGLTVSMQQGFVQGLPRLQKSLAIHRQYDFRHEQCFSLVWLAYATYLSDDAPQARQHLMEALKIGLEIRTWTPLWLILPLAGMIWAEQDVPERAIELHAFYLAICLGAWQQGGLLHDLAGRKIAAIAHTLPPEVVTSAQQRGQQRELWETVAELLRVLIS